MSNNQIQIDLVEKTDRNGDSYYVGGLDVPLTVQLDQISFFVFHPSESEDRPKATLMLRKTRPFTNPKTGNAECA